MFWFILLSDLSIPLMMIVLGMIMIKRPPKTINRFVGFRTKRSMKNQDTWQFAHKHCGRSWLILGLILVIPTAAAHIPFYHSSENTLSIVSCIVLTIQLIALLLSAVSTNLALKKNFHTDGSRK